MSDGSLKKRILIPLTLGLSALLVCFLVSLFWIEQNNLKQRVDRQLEAADLLLKFEQENDAHLFSAMLETIMNDRDIQKALLAKDRKALLAHTGPLFKRLSAQHPVTHLYFSDAQRINLLRVHQPERFGDRIDRFTTLKAERSGGIAYGLELGPLGTLTLRVVAPMILNGTRIGFVELGEEIDHFTAKLKKTLGVELIVYLYKKALTRSDWETGMKMMGRTPDWDHFPEVVVIQQTLKDYPKTLSSFFSQGSHLPGVTDVEFFFENRWYRGRFLDIRDVQGAEVGDMVVMTDVTAQRTRLYSFMGIIAIFSFFLGGVLFVIFRFFLGRVEKQMIQDQQKIVELEKDYTRIEAEAKFFSVAQSVNDAMISSDTSGKIIFWNRAAVSLFGYQEDEVLEQPLTLIIPERYREAHLKGRERLQSGVESRMIGKTTELFGVKKDGTEFPLELSLAQWTDGKDIFFTGLIRDITIRKRAEEEKRKLEEQLQRAEKMEALGILAGGVAHDLNNVLGIVIGYSELLLYDEDPSSPLRPGLLNILSGGQKAAAIVQDLLTLARRGVSNRQVLNVNKMVIEFQKSPEFENLAAYHASVKIQTDLEPGLLNISGSSVHLGKALFNLVSNACEAMPKGGTLTIKTSNQYLDRPIQGYDEVKTGDYVVLSVSDTGEGIPATDLKRIFEPFYTKKVMGKSGTGLGLAVVWGTVKDHQGYINVESEEEKGSTFTLYFPVTREEISVETDALSIFRYLGKGETILIVDDVKGQRGLSEDMLKKLNYNPISVSSGEEAVAYLKGQPVDLLVLDMIMDPGMDGLDTYRSVLEIRPGQKAILISGFSETGRVNAAQALGAGAYVKKPYTIEQLGLAVREELDRVPHKPQEGMGNP